MRQTAGEDTVEQKPTSPTRWVARLLLFFLVISVCLGASFLLYVRWLGAGRVNAAHFSGGGSGLNAAERLYLETYLAARAEQLAVPIGSGDGSARFVIESGQAAGDVAAELIASGLLQDETLFLNYLRYHGLDSQLEAGTYQIDPQWSIPDLALNLTQSYAQEIELRFLEGWRAEEMAGYISTIAPAEIEAEQFLDVVQRRQAIDLSDYPSLAAFPADRSLEGYLFPDTYRVALDADAAALTHLMLANFERRLTGDMRSAFEANGLSLHEAVTLASIVERETPLASERPMVAGVFYNRLAQGIRLQADPTVQYVAGFDPVSGSWWKSPLTQADLDRASPYNTYVSEGLPPGPIANPGLASLQAVARPAQTDNLYFVADCNAEGAHRFSETYAEHVQNVDECRP